MRTHTLSTNKKNKKNRRGRGISTGRGAKSGRGQKGQKARSGGRVRRGFEGGRTPVVRKFPKLRGVGYKNSRPRQARYSAISITLGDLNKKFANGEVVSPRTLKKSGLIGSANAKIKIVTNGDFDKKLKFRNITFSQKALEIVKKAGSEILYVPGTKKEKTEEKTSKK